LKALLIVIVLVIFTVTANSATCGDNVKVFLSNSKMRIQKLTMADLEYVIQKWMDQKNEEIGYLTGLSPTWNATKVEELATELEMLVDANTKYANIVGNLNHGRHLAMLVKQKKDLKDELLKALLKDTRMALLFMEWRKRLKVVSALSLEEMD